MTTRVRYIVEDTATSVEFYERLGFHVDMHPGPGFAMLSRGDLQLLLNTPGGGGGAGRAMDDGRTPEPGGWNRFVIEVDDIDKAAGDLAAAGATLRSAVIDGNGGRQVLVDDPSGNAVELFEPKR